MRSNGVWAIVKGREIFSSNPDDCQPIEQWQPFLGSALPGVVNQNAVSVGHRQCRAGNYDYKIERFAV